MCGEHSSRHDHCGCIQGSSPRVRGTLFAVSVVVSSLGIIPACAGNTLCIDGIGLPTRDHPRVCGEHESIVDTSLIDVGSSPRVRGTLLIILSEIGWVGIIPACAGNTSPHKSASEAVRDHPRVCGEHLREIGSETIPMGSSPRVRGTQQLVKAVGDIVGIIPACAGNTVSLTMPMVGIGDHPRVCGEH